MKTAKHLRKKINTNEKKLSKDLAAINRHKMGALLKRIQTSVLSLRRQTELTPEQAVVEATNRRKRRVDQQAAFTIDRAPELDEAILLRRQILTTLETTDESATSSVESDADASECSEFAEGEDDDLKLCVKRPQKVAGKRRGEDPWWLHPEDCDPAKSPNRHQGRYFHSEGHQCELCDMRGHFGDNCPLGAPICVLCGKLGHRKTACRNVVCHACLKTGHSVSACPLAAKRRDAKCLRCGTMGHIAQDCFEKWRQYHVTTAPGSTRPVKSKQRPNRLAYCSNCGKKGHFSESCFQPHPNYHHIFSPGSIFVSSYDEEPTFAALPETPKNWRREEEKKKTKEEETHDSPVPDGQPEEEAAGTKELGDFVPISKDLKRKPTLMHPDVAKKGKRNKRQKKKVEQDRPFESADGVRKLLSFETSPKMSNDFHLSLLWAFAPTWVGIYRSWRQKNSRRLLRQPRSAVAEGASR